MIAYRDFAPGQVSAPATMKPVKLPLARSRVRWRHRAAGGGFRGAGRPLL